MLVLIQAHKGRSFFSRLIKWFTRSEYSHISTWFVQEAVVIESREGKGVIERSSTLFQEAILKGVISVYKFDITEEQKEQMLREMRATLGKKYDWLHVAKFVTRRRGSSDDRWFCSEHFLHHAQSARVSILNMDPWLADPGHIVRSPNVTKLTLSEIPL